MYLLLGLGLKISVFIWCIDCMCRCLTLSWRKPLSYRIQSIYLRSKSMDWFLYDNGLRHERVKVATYIWCSDCMRNELCRVFKQRLLAMRAQLHRKSSKDLSIPTWISHISFSLIFLNFFYLWSTTFFFINKIFEKDLKSFWKPVFSSTRLCYK